MASRSILRPGPCSRLAPRIVLAGNAAVFTAKYGSAPWGVFTGNLANGGERLILSLGGSTALRDFTYDNNFPWPTASDNGGASLVLIAPQTNPEHANPLNWRSSAAAPNPGTSDTAPFTAWQISHNQPDANADTDGDGLTAFAEYSLGGDPSSASLSPLPVMIRQPDGSAVLTFTKPLTADDSAWELQSDSDLSAWTAAAATLVEREVTAGSETFTFTIPASAFADARRYWRVRLWLR